MTPKPDSSCCRHAAAGPPAGICPACLRDRLSGIGSGDGGIGDGDPNRRSKAAGDAASSSLNSDLRRCRSVSVSNYGASSSLAEPRRMSCDVRARNTLALLFDLDDEKSRPGAGSIVETKEISKLASVSLEFGGEIRVPVDELQKNVSSATAAVADDDNGDESDLKTMKEFMDLEMQSKNQKPSDLRDIAGNFWEAASVFSNKLRKWRKNQTKKIESGNGEGIRGDKRFSAKQKGNETMENSSEIGEYAMGRRSCDAGPRFSVDVGMLSVQSPRVSIEKPRASWDGCCLVARTALRPVPPPLSPIESLMLKNETRLDNHRLSVDGQMQSIVEDESSSGGSGQSNSDSSSSQRWSSFDRSSSVKSVGVRSLGLESDEAKPMSNVKLVITERELKDWHLKSLKKDHSDKPETLSKNVSPVETCKTSNASKKSTRWRKVCSVLGFKHKTNDNLSPVLNASEDVNMQRLTRSSSVVRARNSCDKIESMPRRSSISECPSYANTIGERFVLERNKSTKNINSENGSLPFYLMPLRSIRSRSRNRNKLLDSHFSGNVLNCTE